MTEQTESESLESSWQDSELRRAQDSIDRLSQNGSDSCQPTDHHQEIAKWAATLTGVTLNRYLIEAMLGHGGFGVVFRAFDSELNRHVAIKIPRPDVFATRDTRERFLDEARVVAALRHPGIVQVLDVVSMGPLLLIASELSTGVTLQDWIRSQTSPIKPNIAARIVMELAATIGFAHSRGVIHQDLKPANILMEWSDGNRRDAFPESIRVTDFGLACRFLADGIVPGSLAGGTRRYMAPEQAGDVSQVGTHTDVFALGVILDEMLAVATTNGQGIAAVRSKHVPKNLWAIRERCLQSDPANRYRHATELHEDLRRFCNLQPVVARKLGLAERAMLSFQRRPVVSLMIGALVLLTTLGTMGIAWQWREAARQRAAAEQRLRESESLLVRMNWVLDESYFWNDTPYNFESDFRRELSRDFSTFVLSRSDQSGVSVEARAAAVRRLGHEAFEENDFATGERLTRESLVNWRLARTQDPANRVFRRSAALTAYYLTIYGFSSGKNFESFLDLDKQLLVPGFSWRCRADVELAEDLADLLHLRAVALSKTAADESARATHAATSTIWRQLADTSPQTPQYEINFARENIRMGECDIRLGNHRRAATELIQAIAFLAKLMKSVESHDLHVLWLGAHRSAASALVATNQQSDAVKLLSSLLEGWDTMTCARCQKCSTERAQIELELSQLSNSPGKKRKKRAALAPPQ